MLTLEGLTPLQLSIEDASYQAKKMIEKSKGTQEESLFRMMHRDLEHALLTLGTIRELLEK